MEPLHLEQLTAGRKRPLGQLFAPAIIAYKIAGKHDRVVYVTRHSAVPAAKHQETDDGFGEGAEHAAERSAHRWVTQTQAAIATTRGSVAVQQDGSGTWECILRRGHFKKYREDGKLLIIETDGLVLRESRCGGGHTGRSLSMSRSPSAMQIQNAPRKIYQRSKASWFLTCAKKYDRPGLFSTSSS
jgi:hypothetical protein